MSGPNKYGPNGRLATAGRRSVLWAVFWVFLAAAGFAAWLPQAWAQSEPNRAAASSSPEIVVTVLGSGTPVPSATQFGAAILVQAGGQHLLFDCGRGCTTRLAQYDASLITKIETLFVTHLHSDHIVGIDDLWLNGWTQGRVHPLRIWGPEGTSDMMRHMRETFRYDIEKRYEEGVPNTLSGIADGYNEVAHDGVIYDNKGVTVSAFKVDHANVAAWGYRIDYNGRAVMISGDTTMTENLYTYGNGADLILQEVVSPALVAYLRAHFSPDQVARIIGYHTTAGQAAVLFKAAKPRIAVYYHTRNDGEFAQSLLDETAKGYGGRVEVSGDLFQVEIGDEIRTRTLGVNRQ